MGTNVLSPIILSDILNGIFYKEFLAGNVPNFLEKFHYQRGIKLYSNKIILDHTTPKLLLKRVISWTLNGPGLIPRFTRTPDLNPLDFFFLGIW